MKKLAMTLTAGLLAAGTLTAMSMMASAEMQVPNTASFQAAIKSSSPIIQQIDCHGTTGTHGCGAGWYWRDGYRGWACYRC